MKKECSRKKWMEIFKYVPQVSVDTVVLNKKGEILLIRRSHSPWNGYWALPGGFVQKGETVENASVRECMEESGVKIKIKMFNGVYSNPKRDPRGHVISVSFIAEHIGGKLRGSNETSDARFFSIKEIPKRLAADHKLIIRDALKKLSKKR